MANMKKRILILILIHAMLVMELGLVRVKSAELSEEAGGIEKIEVETDADEADSMIDSSIAKGSDTVPEQLDEAADGSTEYQEQRNEADDFTEEAEDTTSGRDTEIDDEEKLDESEGSSPGGSGTEYQEQQNEAGYFAGEAEDAASGEDMQMDDDVALVKADGKIFYVNVQELWELFRQKCNEVEILLLDDVSSEERFLVDGGAAYELDLNGKTISKFSYGDTSPNYVFEIANGMLSIKDTGEGGCIIHDKGPCVWVRQNNRFKISGGTLKFLSRGILIDDNAVAEVTGNTRIIGYIRDQSGEVKYYRWHGIVINNSGTLFLSGDVEVSGQWSGICVEVNSSSIRPVSCKVVISGQPNIHGNEYGVYMYDFDGQLSADISGGTFSGAQSAFKLAKINGRNIFLSDVLSNYGTNEATNYAFFDSDKPIDPKTTKIPGTVTVRECTHQGSEYTHLDGAAEHSWKCRDCGSEKREGCSYECKREGTVFHGLCSCGSKLKVMLQQEPDYVYNGREHQLQISVTVDETLLEPDDYAIFYEDNRNAGTAKVRVEGKNGRQFSCSMEFGIAPAPLAVTGADVQEREYDGTDKVKISAVHLAGIVAGDDVKVVTDNLAGTIAGTGAGSYDAVTLPGNMALAGADAGNYVLPGSAQTAAASVDIHKAKAAAMNGRLELEVQAGQKKNHKFLLDGFCPELPQNQEFGSSPVSYVLGDVSLSEKYYNGDASIDEAQLILPVLAAEDVTSGNIGTVQIIIQTANFEDINVRLEVHAIVKSHADYSSGIGHSEGTVIRPPTEPEPFLKTNQLQKGWAVIRQTAKDAAEGSTVAVVMNGTDTVPVSMFKAIQGRDIDVEFDMGCGFAWCVNGQDIVDNKIEHTDFSIKTTDKIPLETVNAAAEKLVHTEPILIKDMEFDFSTKLAIQTPKISWTSDTESSDGNSPAAGYPGMYANLFYYNEPENKLECAVSKKIDENGDVQFSFLHGDVLIENGEDQEPEHRCVQSPGSQKSILMVVLSKEPMDGKHDEPDSPASECIQIESVNLLYEDCIYNNEERKPAVDVKNTEGESITDDYYKVSYKNNKQAGIATACVQFESIHESKVILNQIFTIRPAGTSIKKAAAASKAFSVKWIKDSQGDGYEIQYSTNAKFQKKTTQSVLVKNVSVTHRTISKLKPSKNYYVRIRTYKIVEANGERKTIYSDWSEKVRTGPVLP